MLCATVVAACATTVAPTASSSDAARSGAVPTLAPTAPPASPASTPIIAATELPTFIPPCIRQGDSALAGVVDSRPVGWSRQREVAALPGFPKTYGAVYAPDGIRVPPDEGPGRLVLYETLPASDAYFEARIDQSRKHEGKPMAVTVCGEATEVWLVESTGELVVGWTDRDKSDILVANAADFTIQQLVDIAERVYDCCG